MDTFRIKRGNRLPALQATLTDQDGAVIDLTDCSVEFVMRKPGHRSCERVVDPVVVRGDAVIVDAANGVVRYDWGTNDTSVIGSYQAEFIVTEPGGKTYSAPSDGFIPVSVDQSLA